MGVSVPLLITTWLLAQQPGDFDLEGREFSAQSVGDAAFLNVGPVPITSEFQPGAGSLSLVATERIGQSSATFGDQAELSATLRIGIDEIRVELVRAGFPPAQSFSEDEGTGAIPSAPHASVNGGVRVGGWVHGSTEAGFLWGGRAPAAFSVYGVGRVFVNGQVISERAVVQAHALTAGRFSDDARHLLQPSLRPEDLEVQVIATGLPRSIVPGGFVELHFDEVSISTPEGTLTDASPLGGAVGTQAELVVPEGFRPGGLVFNLPPELPGVGGSGVVDTSGTGLEGSGPVFGTAPTDDTRGFLSGTGPAFGTGFVVEDRTGTFSGEGPIFSPEASPNIAGGATGVASSAEESATGEAPGVVDSLTTTGAAPLDAEASTAVALPDPTGSLTPGTPLRGRVIGANPATTPGLAGFEDFGPGVNTETFGPGNAARFGPGASQQVFGPGAVGGSAETAEVFPTVPEATPGIPETPFSLSSATGLPQRTTPLNATPAVPRIQTVSPLNSQPATPLNQDGIAPLNSLPAGSTPPGVGTTVPVNPATGPLTSTPGSVSGPASPSGSMPGSVAGPGGVSGPGGTSVPVAPATPVAPSGQ